MPRPPLTPEEYRKSEGLPEHGPGKKFGYREEEVWDSADSLAGTLHEKSIPEMLETRQEEAGIVTDRLMNKLGRSAEKKVYDDWHKKYWSLHGEIIGYFEPHADDPLIPEVSGKLQELDRQQQEFTQQHQQDKDFVAEDIQQIVTACDRMQTMLDELHKKFGSTKNA